jgi:hypothetical protein
LFATSHASLSYQPDRRRVIGGLHEKISLYASLRFFTSLKMTIHSPPVFDHLRLASEWRSFVHRQMEKSYTPTPTEGLPLVLLKYGDNRINIFKSYSSPAKKLRPASEGRCRYATGKIGYAAIGRTHRSAPTVHAVGFADTACRAPTVDDKTNHSARCGAE